MQFIYIQVFNRFGTVLELDFSRMCNMWFRCTVKELPAEWMVNYTYPR